MRAYDSHHIFICVRDVGILLFHVATRTIVTTFTVDCVRKGWRPGPNDPFLLPNETFIMQHEFDAFLVHVPTGRRKRLDINTDVTTHFACDRFVQCYHSREDELSFLEMLQRFLGEYLVRDVLTIVASYF
jgi:hypothetical protein